MLDCQMCNMFIQRRGPESKRVNEATKEENMQKSTCRSPNTRRHNGQMAETSRHGASGGTPADQTLN